MPSSSPLFFFPNGLNPVAKMSVVCHIVGGVYQSRLQITIIGYYCKLDALFVSDGWALPDVSGGGERHDLFGVVVEEWSSSRGSRVVFARRVGAGIGRRTKKCRPRATPWR